jgi:Flp pilus assembly protein TadG
MRRFLVRVRSSEDGQALVEFALVAPLLVLLVFGILDFGRAFNYKNDLTNLVNTAARYAEVDLCNPCGSGEQIDQYVKSTADSSSLRDTSLGKGAAISFCFPAGSTGQIGEQLKAKVTYTYTWLPLIKSVIGSAGTTTLTSSVIVRVQKTYDNTNYTAAPCT